jgi:hypothetical protein
MHPSLRVQQQDTHGNSNGEMLMKAMMTRIAPAAPISLANNRQKKARRGWRQG